jgi:hypothetical protein
MAVSLALQSILDKAYFKYSRSLDYHLLVDDRSDNVTLSKDYIILHLLDGILD